MKIHVRVVVLVVALAGSFGVGRASNLLFPGGPAPAAPSQAAVEDGQPGAPWAQQGFRTAECQGLGDIIECD
jgi:hypothetical protein